jgi:hypothetical protein
LIGWIVGWGFYHALIISGKIQRGQADSVILMGTDRSFFDFLLSPNAEPLLFVYTPGGCRLYYANQLLDGNRFKEVSKGAFL